MGNSLQEQMLKAGLVTEDDVRKSQERPRKPARDERPARRGEAPRKAKGKSSGKGRRPERGAVRAPRPAAAPAPAPVVDARADKAARKALRARVRELVQRHRVDDPEADIQHHFVEDGRIHHVYVTAAQRPQLIAGELAVVRSGARLHLVPAAAAEELRAVHAPAVVFVSDGAAPPAADTDPDDPYADYPVPDDLTW